MKVTYPKVKIDSKNRVYISFYQNNKRYRLFNGSKINSEIYPNIFPNSKRLEMGHLLAAEVYTFLMSGLTIQKANISELIRPNMLDKDYLFIALNNKLKGNYTDKYTKQLSFIYNKLVEKIYLRHSIGVLNKINKDSKKLNKIQDELLTWMKTQGEVKRVVIWNKAKNLGIKERTLADILKRFLRLNLIKKVTHGVYVVR